MKIPLSSYLICVLGCCLAATIAGASERTEITSATLEMQGTESRNFFHFRTDVRVVGTNLELRCDELTVIALRRSGEEEDSVGEIGAIEQIIAVGNVEIRQAGRVAYAGRAEVNPRAGTVTLMDGPRVIDRDVEVQGFQFVLHQGERRFESIPDPDAPADRPSRSVVRLGALPDLGFDQDEEGVSIGGRSAEAVLDLSEESGAEDTEEEMEAPAAAAELEVEVENEGKDAEP